MLVKGSESKMRGYFAATILLYPAPIGQDARREDLMLVKESHLIPGLFIAGHFFQYSRMQDL